MSNLLIHGDNQILSRNYLVSQKAAAQKQQREIISINGRQTSLNELIQSLETQSLFGGDRLVIIEDLHKNPSKKTLKEIVLYLSKREAGSSQLIMWSSALLTPTQLKPFISWNMKPFKASPIIFSFLDSLLPGNQRIFLPLFDEACQKDSPEFVFFMLERQVRQLFLVQTTDFKAHPFIISKLKKQQEKYTEAQLISFHDSLVDIDYRSKTGQMVSNLQSELSYLLAKLR